MSANEDRDRDMLAALASLPRLVEDKQGVLARRVITGLSGAISDRVAKFAILVGIGLNPHDAAHFARLYDVEPAPLMDEKAAAELSELAKKYATLLSFVQELASTPVGDPLGGRRDFRSDGPLLDWKQKAKALLEASGHV